MKTDPKTNAKNKKATQDMPTAKAVGVSPCLGEGSRRIYDPPMGLGMESCWRFTGPSAWETQRAVGNPKPYVATEGVLGWEQRC